MTSKTIYSELIEMFGEARVKAWTLARKDAKYENIEFHYQALRDDTRDYYEAQGVNWQDAPTIRTGGGCCGGGV